jgi:hypothetical protein
MRSNQELFRSVNWSINRDWRENTWIDWRDQLLSLYQMLRCLGMRWQLLYYPGLSRNHEGFPGHNSTVFDPAKLAQKMLRIRVTYFMLER